MFPLSELFSESFVNENIFVPVTIPNCSNPGGDAENRKRASPKPMAAIFYILTSFFCFQTKIITYRIVLIIFFKKKEMKTERLQL